ncbi:MAG: hypothetical protein K6E51_12040 [Treponema sp.]|nr:hypothetical protein [Treponema sp.]
MQVKRFIKLFIPPIVFKIRNFLYNVWEKKSFVSTISKIDKRDDTLIVLGNGPSLTQTLEMYKKKIKLHDFIVVSHFCETAYYSELQPKYYLFADPSFFGDLDTYADWHKEKIGRCITSLVNNTKWDINLIVPNIAYGSKFIAKVSENSMIHPYYYNPVDMCHYEDDEKFKLWDKNLLGVPSQTCLNTCLWLGIFLRYKEVFLVGADTNWIELLHVDQKTNEVYTIDSHFYGQKRLTLYKNKEGTVPVKLYEELVSNAEAFKLYWELKAYADYAGVKVFNASEYSLIDAFERKRISDL